MTSLAISIGADVSTGSPDPVGSTLGGGDGGTVGWSVGPDDGVSDGAIVTVGGTVGGSVEGEAVGVALAGGEALGPDGSGPIAGVGTGTTRILSPLLPPAVSTTTICSASGDRMTLWTLASGSSTVRASALTMGAQSGLSPAAQTSSIVEL